MKIKTQHLVKSIEWDQIKSGTKFVKFTASDDGGPNRDYRVVLHGLVSEDGDIFITDELISSDPAITGGEK